MKPLRIIAVTALVASGAVLGYALAEYSGLFPRRTQVSLTGLPQIGGPFTLVNQYGKAVTDTDFRGKVMVIYFGYSFCPDICPTELAKIATALDNLGADSDKVVPLFITIDPDRDTPDKVREYVAQFHPRLIGLTGSVEQVRGVAKEYRVYFTKSGDTTSPYYAMDHSSLIYLMGRDGSYRGIARPDTTAEALADAIRNAIHS
jgi:protein SCO1/2